MVKLPNYFFSGKKVSKGQMATLTSIQPGDTLKLDDNFSFFLEKKCFIPKFSEEGKARSEKNFRVQKRLNKEILRKIFYN